MLSQNNVTFKVKISSYFHAIYEEVDRMITSNVKQIMEEKKVSIRAMAEATGLSNMTILQARRRISRCRLSTLEIIAGYFCCRVKELFEEA